nr:MAG TPA: hypothetical protein [Caudoviricetes sp.]
MLGISQHFFISPCAKNNCNSLKNNRLSVW